MEAPAFLLFCLLVPLHYVSAARTGGTEDGMERWGYTTVRPKAHMFWWHYKSPQQVSSPGKPWPTILWLQGGPGVSGVGHGNFLEIGPLDVNLKPRNSTWLQKADLIFVDSPVGVGYSYVDDPSALATTDMQAASDVFEVLKALSMEIPALQRSPLFLVGESYGGKHAAIIGVLVMRAIKAGTSKLTLGGVVLGDSWISPDDHALSYPWLLQAMSRLDDNAVSDAIRMGVTLKQQMVVGQFTEAYKTFIELMKHIDLNGANINLEDMRLDATVASITDLGPGPSFTSQSNNLSKIMNGVIRQKPTIGVPSNLTWQDVSLQVFNAISNEFMRPAISEIDELLTNSANVIVYNGQYDLICSTIGTEAWVKRLKWHGLQNFLSLPRTPLFYCHPVSLANGFVRSHKNLSFYWILGAGHTVPVDQPCTALHMIDSIIQSAVSNSYVVYPMNYSNNKTD